MSDDDGSTQDRLRIGRWLPPFDEREHDEPALPPTTALIGEIVGRRAPSAPPGRLWPRHAPRSGRGRALGLIAVAVLGALAVFTLLTLVPLSRNGTPPTEAGEGPQLTAVPAVPGPATSSPAGSASASAEPSVPPGDPSPVAVNLTANPTTGPDDSGTGTGSGTGSGTTTAPTRPPGGGTTPTASPSPTGTPVLSGSRLSLEPLTLSGYRVRHQNFVGRVDAISSRSSALDRADATFTVRVGLADSRCVSFESANYPGYYLRHQNFRVYLHRYDGTQLFRADTTFCAVTGLAGQYTSLRSYNYPDRYLRHRGDRQLYLDPYDGGGSTAAAMTFAVRAGL